MTNMTTTNLDILTSGESARAEIQRGLGRIEGKLDSLTNVLSDHTKDDHYNFESVTKNFFEVNKTIATIQRNMNRALGVISFLAICIPISIAYFKH